MVWRGPDFLQMNEFKYFVPLGAVEAMTKSVQERSELVGTVQ